MAEDNYLAVNKFIKFLLENYEIEHTLSIDDAIEDMAVIAQKR